MEEIKTSASGAPVPEVKKTPDIVARVHELIRDKHPQMAESFLELKYIKEACGKDEAEARKLVNRQLRLHLAAKPADTDMARLALDDQCHTADYLRNLKRYAIPKL